MKRNGRHRTSFVLLCLLAAVPACTQVAGLDHPYMNALDAPCQSSADCPTGVCNGTPGWCTDACASDGDCPGGFCIENRNKVFACFPECTSDADCGVFGVSALVCLPSTTADGIIAPICTLPPPP
jgi:hypothetical protein